MFVLYEIQILLNIIHALFHNSFLDRHKPSNYLRHGHNSILLIFILNSISVAIPKHIFY